MTTNLPSAVPSARSDRGRRGSVSLLVVVILSAVAVMALAVASISLVGTRFARTGQDKVTGLTLAEAGVDDTVATLTADTSIVTNLGTTSTYSVSGSLYEDAAKTVRQGSYSAILSWVDKPSGRLKVVSTGTNANNTTRTVVARITQGTMALGNAALLSNGPVTTGGTTDIETTNVVTPPVASYAHVANVYGNGNVSFGGSANVDGSLISAGTVTGTAYYPSVSNAPKYPFPTAATVTAMNTQWLAQAQQSGSKTYAASNLFPGNKSSVTVSAPAYITGDLKMVSGQTLTLTGSGIVYITGSLTMNAGASIINGSALVVGGTFSQAGQSSYTADMTASPTPTLAVYTGDVGLNGGSTNLNWGIIYAVNGGVSVNGNAMFTGALVAGGSGSSVSVTGTYTQFFPTNMASAISMPSIPVVTHIEEL